MLTHLRVQNFKAWRDTGPLRLAPLTILFGGNSAGKSSLGHLLLALKQTMQSSDLRRALQLGDRHSLIDLGTFRDCVYGHDVQAGMSFELGWDIPKGLTIADPLTNTRYEGDALRLDVALKEFRDQPQAYSIEYQLTQNDQKTLSVTYKKKDDGKYNLESDPYKLVRTQSRAWPLGEPEKFYRISDETRARFQNAAFLSDLALAAETAIKRLYYLGPLREHPQRVYAVSGEGVEHVGVTGKDAVAAMLTAKGRKLNRGLKTHTKLFQAFIAERLQELGLIDSFVLKPVAAGRKEYEVLVKTHPKSSEVTITDVGFGISQVLPAIVQAFYVPANSTVLMEQPEIHLHPKVQADLADAFITAIKARENGEDRNVQLIIESHSEHFLTRLQRRVAEDVISPDQVAIYYCQPGGEGAELAPLKLDIFGDIAQWPTNFFGDEMADVTARLQAAAKRDASRQTGA